MNENLKRVVLIGGPGTGKTSLIRKMANNNLNVHQEVSREITLKAQESGIDQLFLTDPHAFSDQLLAGRIQQFLKATSGTHFYDRGIPDIPAYHVFTGDSIPDSYIDACKKYRYHTVFFLAPWEDIYKADNERYETFEQAVIIGNILKEFYESQNYQVITIPKDTIEKRINFILNHLID